MQKPNETTRMKTARGKAKIHQSLLLHDLARLEYGRILWKNPRIQTRLIAHWQDEKHPHHARFKENKMRVQHLLESDPKDDDELNENLLKDGLSLRVLVREIPPVFGTFFSPKMEANSRAPRSRT